jgi:hypothetical protein
MSRFGCPYCFPGEGQGDLCSVHWFKAREKPPTRSALPEPSPPPWADGACPHRFFRRPAGIRGESTGTAVVNSVNGGFLND